MRENPFYRLENFGALRSKTDVLRRALRVKRGGNDSARISHSKGSQHGELRERILPTRPEPPLGAHVVTPRRGYLHHGIYVGGGKIVHYAGLGQGLHRGPVEEVPLAHFTRSQPAWVRSDTPPKFDHWEVIQRARSRIGEDCYRLMTNNCEHFCEWCLRGEHRSYQVEVWLTRANRALHATVQFLARWRHP